MHRSNQWFPAGASAPCTVDAPEALYERFQWRKIRIECVEINVKADLNHLSCNQYDRAPFAFGLAVERWGVGALWLSIALGGLGLAALLALRPRAAG